MTLKDLKERPLSHSSMKAFAKSPKHFINYRNSPIEPTQAMLFGSAFHKFLLEGESAFNKSYLVIGKMDMRKKESKEKMEELLSNAGDKLIINDIEMHIIHKMKDAIVDDPIAGNILHSCTHFEVELFFEIGGLPFRGFVDAAKLGKNGFWMDLKTTNDAYPDSFRKNFYYSEYATQHSVYYEALRQNFYDVTAEDAFTIAIETSSPYGVSVYRLSEDRINKGLNDMNELVSNFKKCMEDNLWDQSYTFNNNVIIID